ncbi:MULTISPECIES: hypothetical protein [Acinetobacter]|uniref:Uncharacterized protein n=2 Tax=Acinetobacter calcoaceticus/baumannii complex TaxID=909768 RepID=A0A2P1B521_ACIBA|nr:MULTISPECIES: hypothetical protein [Acinetobacter]AVI31834.1 hypothetical protein CSB70_1410 [Acinetobacter baumannii]AVI33438.1 hypothetical protein CSB70_1563 [Acinetobacter baumannii]AVI36844.1 hypothetical protein CSB68_1821 [Acinetobacter baumannii]AVI37178.1 hypothetical protein CSB68_1668 [Acinetobacter baumannii]EHU1237150.1 hypothetical protein [Acinetobacter baumannii]
MKIEYLKQMHDANVGDIKDVPDLAANVLIKIGVAKPYEEQKKAPAKPKKEVKPIE